MTVKHVCAATDCDTTFAPVTTPGRPQIYCSPACRPSHPGQNRRPQPVTVHIEADRTATTTARSFTVELRRGDDTVTIRTGLGRFSAAVLAHDLSQLLNLTNPTDTPTTD